MAEYMGLRIIQGVYTFTYVVSKRPDLQPGIESYLVEQGKGDLIND